MTVLKKQINDRKSLLFKTSLNPYQERAFHKVKPIVAKMLFFIFYFLGTVYLYLTVDFSINHHFTRHFKSPQHKSHKVAHFLTSHCEVRIFKLEQPAVYLNLNLNIIHFSNHLDKF